MLARAAADLAPHDLAFYLRDLSAAFHSYYAAERFLVDDAALARARMALLAATRQVLRNALAAAGRERARSDGARSRGPARGGRMKAQRGGFMVGLVVGLLIGLALALGVALYVTKVPVPFINKVPQRTADQDAAEAERNKTWDPNAGLATKPAARPAAPAGPAAREPGTACRHAAPAAAAVGRRRRPAAAARAASKPGRSRP